MKKSLIALAFLSINNLFAFGQTAVDFTANDCNSTSHHLFAELDAGKIIVMSIVMPCNSCIGPSQSAYYVVQGYAASHPGKVVFYISVDNGSPACSTVTSWASLNSMSGVPCFSDAGIKQSDYGATAMPKILAFAGANHQVIYKEDNSLNTANLQNAINAALITSAVPQTLAGNSGFSIYPNPANNKISITYTLDEQSDVSIDIVNMIGKKVKTVIVENNAIGRHLTNIDLNDALPNGIYFVKLNAGKNSQSLRFTISR